MYRTKAIYQLSDLKQSSLKILRLFKIYCQSGSQAPVDVFDNLSQYVVGRAGGFSYFEIDLHSVHRTH